MLCLRLDLNFYIMDIVGDIMKNKKSLKLTTLGFTLVELLAVIVVLGVILAIAIPNVLNIIEKARIDAIIKNEEMMVNAAKKYLVSNTNILPVNVGNTIEVTLDSLKTNRLIDSIKNPRNNQECNGYVLVTKIGTNEYDYSPQLNCVDNTRGNSSSDKLVAYYKFDDFQEPTTNLFLNPSLELSLSHITAGWEFNISRTSEVVKDKNFSIKSVRSSNISHGRAFVLNSAGVSGGFIANRFYTVSCDVYVDNNHTATTLSIADHSGTTLNRTSNTYDINKKGTWQRIWFTFQVDTIGTSPIIVIQSNNGTLTIGDTFYVDAIQIEEKPYITPFAEGTRTGTVQDYSGSGNNANLSLATTPRWISNAKVGTGAYSFNTNTRIDLPLSMNNTNYGLTNAEYTFSMWIRLNRHNSSGVGLIMGMAYYSGFGISVSSDGSSTTSLATYFRNSTLQYSTNNISLDLNQWYHVTAVLDKPNLRIIFHLNGNLIHERTITNGPFIYENYPFAINRLSQTGGNGPWVNIDGVIDDVRIYNRVLSAEEILHNYNVNK